MDAAAAEQKKVLIDLLVTGSAYNVVTDAKIVSSVFKEPFSVQTSQLLSEN